MNKQRAAEAFRKPMAVTQIRLFPADGAYPVCPQCSSSMEREYQRFCDRCGQCLSWKNYKQALVIFPKNPPQFQETKESWALES